MLQFILPFLHLPCDLRAMASLFQAFQFNVCTEESELGSLMRL